MTGPPAHPDPEGHHDDLDPQDAARLTLLVPDDASELESDRLAWLAEDRAAPVDLLDPLDMGRHDGDPRKPRPRPRRRLAILAGVTACAVLAMSVLGATLALFSPGGGTTPAARTPLAVATADPGHLDGLLPAATLTGDTGSVASTDLRPAVVALVPSGCGDCAQRLAAVAGQVADYGLPLVLVGGPTQHTQLQTLAASLVGRPVSALVDRDLTLRAAFESTATGASSLLLLLVRADGTLYTVVNDPAADAPLGSALVHIGTSAAGH